MEFEYGCQTTNKYAFLNESDVEDPSELLAKAATEAAPVAKPAGKGKPASAASASTKTGGAAKPASAQGARDAKKEPLKQQTDNSAKPAPRRPVGMGPKPTIAEQTPRDGKENTSNRPASGLQSGGDRPPRNFENNRRGPREGGDNQAPRRDYNNPDRPRSDRPRPDRPPRVQGEEGQQDRPPRRIRPQYEGGQHGQAGEEGQGGERRGPRNGGQFRNNRPRRTEGQEHGTREFDRHSGSDKT